MLYPIRTKPIIKEHIWGGRKLLSIKKSQIGRMDESKTYGESWDFSGVRGSVSKVSNGFLKGNSINEIVEVYMGDFVGDAIFEKYGEVFPLLVKTLDCAQKVSVQVHPDDSIANQRHGSCGKTEMWYVQSSEQDSVIYIGFKRDDITREEYLEHVANGTIEQILNPVPVRSGDVFFIPAGTVHALSSGIVVIEIQQPVDLTYRIFDWNRVDANGKSRELHTALAVDAIDFQSTADKCQRKYELPQNGSVKVVDSQYFVTSITHVSSSLERDYFTLDSFVIYECVDGQIEVITSQTRDSLQKGESIIIPAQIDSVELKGLGTIIESYAR
ncbi:MAG: class I mannose-6-phosphate isomerase [Alistipes sp.]|nr:class I mannose-6-phosphate isomerase [Candidatus Alistipes equi]